MFQKNLVNYKNLEAMYITMVIFGCYWRPGLATGGGGRVLGWRFAALCLTLTLYSSKTILTFTLAASGVYCQWRDHVGKGSVPAAAPRPELT